MKLLAEVEGERSATDDKPAASPVYRCAYAPSGEVESLPGNPKNLFDLLKNTVDRTPSLPALGYRPKVGGEVQGYKWITYTDLLHDVAAVGSALRSLGVSPGVPVGICSANSPQWMTTMKAIDWCGGVCVPLYDTFGEDAIKFIIQHSGVKVMFVETNKLETLKHVLPEVKGQVVQVVVWSSVAGESVDEAVMQGVDQSGVPGTVFEKFVEFGASNMGEPSPGKLDDLCTIMYTSGTTGDPKGVEISHRAVLTSVAAIEMLLKQFNVPIDKRDVFLSYLPLAHIFDRIAEEAFLSMGASIGYWQGSAKTLMDDVAALKPTLFVGVPRIFDRIYSGVTAQVSKAGGVQAALFNTAFKIKELFVGLGWTSAPGLDHLVFNKIKQRLGGRVRVILSGGAPLAKHVEHFLKVTMCCPVTQGYGLTETLGASFVANPYSPSEAHTVGAPFAALDLRLDSIPDMGYDAQGTPPRGEVCLRGPSVFVGYHKREDLTKEDKDSEGWFHTGDIGELTPEGALRIIDRKKNFFKLAQGEYVAAEKLENVYKKVNSVDQIWVYGDSERSQLVAVVVVDSGAFKALAKENGKDAGSMSDDEAGQLMQKTLEKEGRAAGLKGFEIVKAVTISEEAFTTDNDLMTPSFKLKRPQLKDRFKSDIDKMYSALN